MRHILQYWKRSSAEISLYPPPFSASDQFGHRNVNVGDRLWIVTLKNARLHLVSGFEIGAFIDRDTAQRRFGTGLYIARLYAVPKHETSFPRLDLDIGDMAPRLRFARAESTLNIGQDGSVDGRQLQSLRRLKASTGAALYASATLLKHRGRRWPDDIEALIAGFGGEAPLEEIYAAAECLRGKAALSGIRRVIQLHSSDTSLYRPDNPDLFFSVDGIGQSVWGLRSTAGQEQTAVDANLQASSDQVKNGKEDPQRRYSHVSRIIRDSAVSRMMKRWYGHKCQICGNTITLPDGRHYVEAHHIRPVGRPHDGPDVPGNILIVCPNHHAMLDFSAIALKIGDLHLHPKHHVLPDSIEFHNSLYARRSGMWT